MSKGISILNIIGLLQIVVGVLITILTIVLFPALIMGLVLVSDSLGVLKWFSLPIMLLWGPLNIISGVLIFNRSIFVWLVLILTIVGSLLVFPLLSIFYVIVSWVLIKNRQYFK